MPAQAWVTLIVGGVAAIGVIVTWQQNNRADRRSEWWRRSTWALERTFSADDGQAGLGWEMLDTPLRSTHATRDDSDVVQVIGQPEADERFRLARSLEVRVAAARAMVTASKKTGRPVEPFVQELAETDLPGNPYIPFTEASLWCRFISALWPNL